MRAGKHVLCEKPIARTVAEAEAMLATADAAGVVFTVGHVARFEADHRKAKEILARGDIGRLRMASQSITGPFPEWSAHGWFADAAQSGGPVLDLAIHSFDYLLWLFQDRVVRVAAVGVREKIAVDGYALVTLRFDNGGIGLVEVSWLHPRGQGLLVRNELCGTHGRLAWDYDAIAALQLVKDDGRQSQTMVPGGWDVQTAGFLHSIREGTAPLVSGREALDALRVGLAALESLAPDARSRWRERHVMGKGNMRSASVRVGILSYAHVGHAVSYSAALKRIEGVQIAAIYDEDRTAAEDGSRFAIPSTTGLRGRHRPRRHPGRDRLQCDQCPRSPGDRRRPIGQAHPLRETDRHSHRGRTGDDRCLRGRRGAVAHPVRPPLPADGPAREADDRSGRDRLGLRDDGRNRGIPPLPPSYPEWITDSVQAGGGGG